MAEKRQYYGLDVVKVCLAVLVAARHVIQLFYPVESRWRMVIGSWLSNLAVPGFFIISGFLLFRKMEDGRTRGDGKILSGYCLRILKMTVLWSALYLPIDIMNWWYGKDGVWQWVLDYLRYFVFNHSIVHLWFLPALIAACGLVWFAYSRGIKIWQILVAGGILFAVGCIGDNWYFNQQLPPEIWKFYVWYFEWFLTMRNGGFYGALFVAMGLWFAKTRLRIPFPAAAAGFLGSLALMFMEVRVCQNVNMVFTSAPTAFFLIAAALSVTGDGKERLFWRLRGLSQWIYLSHVYFLYLFSWTARWNPLRFTKKGIMISVFFPMLLFCGGMVRLSEKERWRWLKGIV